MIKPILPKAVHDAKDIVIYFWLDLYLFYL
jgi:hypothetical protein